MEKRQPMIFHGRKHPKATKRTHTLCIAGTDDNKLKVTWGKVFKGNFETPADTYSRRVGRAVVSEKLARFIETPPRRVINFEKLNRELEKENETPYKVREFLFEHIPAVVADTLPWYVSCASRYFKTKDAVVEIEGVDGKDMSNPVRASIQVNLQDLLDSIKPLKKEKE